MLRDGDDIGTHSLSATLDDRGFVIEIRIDLAVKVLGFTAYSYNLINRETWRDQQLVSVDSRVNDDGDEDFCKVAREGDELSISGSRFTGKVPGSAVTTSYYHPDFISRRPWISSQSGRPLEIDIAPSGENAFQVSGQLTTKLTYDSRGEWMGAEFDAGGELGTYELISETGLISPLWTAS
ncbi:MAG: DUF6134 family protein [Pseudomonadota bacterium]